MRVGVEARFIAGILLLAAAPAFAQAPKKPGPYVVDVRGATSALPNKPGFYPPIPASALIPSRAFGVDAGAHVYLRQFGPSRLGVGASSMWVRATSTTSEPAIHATLTILAPQLSFNFGTGAGWSYVSGGVGVSEIKTTAVQKGAPDATKSSGWRRAVNVGAGARWFIKPRLAVGFDIRLYKIARGTTTPHASPLAASAGLSFR